MLTCLFLIVPSPTQEDKGKEDEAKDVNEQDKGKEDEAKDEEDGYRSPWNDSDYGEDWNETIFVEPWEFEWP